MKYCVVCREARAEEYSFCPSCGNPLQDYHPSEQQTDWAGKLSVGDENVIAGDVIGSKQEYRVEGNATFVRWEDPSREVHSCHICGKNLAATEGYTCPVCGKYSCEEDYAVELRRCARCAQKLERSKAGSPPPPISFSEEQLIKLEMEKLLSDQLTDEDARRLEQLYQRKADNPYVKEAYLEYLVDRNPMRVLELPLAVAREDETDVLSLLVEAQTRLRRFAAAEELIDWIERDYEELDSFLELRRAELYTDLFLSRGSDAALRKAHELVSSAEGEEWKEYRWFVQAYTDWAAEGAHFAELFETVGATSIDELLRLKRKRKTLVSCSDMRRRLSAGSLLHLHSREEFPIILSVSIGREHSFVSLALAGDTSVSRSHARITVSPLLQVYVRDLGSSNGTFIDDRRLSPGRETELSEGSTLSIGEQRFRFTRRQNEP